MNHVCVRIRVYARRDQTKCAICTLAHGSLLDAAHITPDCEEDSSTSVTNGLSLCKIHHTAYDINIVGIDPDYKVHIREDILQEVDGPMLEHGIKEMDTRSLWVPPAKSKQPDACADACTDTCSHACAHARTNSCAHPCTDACTNFTAI